MDTTRRSLSILGLSTLLLVACGGAATTGGPGGAGPASGPPTTQVPNGGTVTQAPSSAATVDACSMLTAADIKAVTGHAVERSTAGAQVGYSMAGCEWDLIDDAAMVPPSIVLGIMTTGGRAYYDKYMAPFNEGAGAKPIAGLGDEAVDAGFGTVMVVSGDAFFNLQYLGSAKDGDHETELARKVLTHLGG